MDFRCEKSTVSFKNPVQTLLQLCAFGCVLYIAQKQNFILKKSEENMKLCNP